jgi:hypothetical protein
MGPFCFLKKDTNPPLCGLHNVPLVKTEISIELIIPNSVPISCYVCPVGKEVVSDPPTPK